MTATAKFRIEGEDASAAAFRMALGNAQGAASKMQGLFRTAFAGIGVASIARFGLHAIELGDDLNKAAIKAGIAGKAMSELAYAAKMSDVDLVALSTSLKKMQVNLSEASTGGKAQIETLHALGIEIGDIKDLAADQQFEMLAEQISRLRDPADRARAATELFGKAGADLLPVMENGAAGIKAYREEAIRTGQSWGEGVLKPLSEADETIKKLKSSFESLGVVLVSQVAGPLSVVVNKLAEIERATPNKLIEIVRAGGIGSYVAGLGSDIGASVFEDDEPARRKVPGRRGGDRGNAGTASPGYVDAAAVEAARKAAAKAHEEEIRRQEEMAKAMRQQLEAARAYWADLNELTMTGTDRQVQQFERIEDALYKQIVAGKISSEEYEQRMGAALDALNEDLGDVVVTAQKVGDAGSKALEEAFDNERIQEVRDRIAGIRYQMEDTFTNFVAHGKLQVGSLVDYMLEEFARLKVVQPMMDSLFSGGFGSFLTAALGGAARGGTYDDVYDQYGGGMAKGGPLQQGKWYTAGERGPEPIWGGGPGAFAAGYGKSGGAAPVISITNHIDARGATQDVIKALPGILNAHGKALTADIITGIRNGKYPV